MPDLRDMPELEDTSKDIDEGAVAIDLKGEGIDFDQLRLGKETLFEVDPSASIPGDEELDRNYFDNEELFKQVNVECSEPGTINGKIAEPFEFIKEGMTDLTGDGGVMKKIIKHGAGQLVSPQSLCRVHYNAYLEYSDEPFDSSRLRGKQHQFKLGSGEILLGWEIGVATMKRGELSSFMVTHKYAYGKMGCPPRIPAEAVVLFEIELISFVDQGASDEFENFSEEERKQASFDQILKVVESLRQTGNEAFQLNQAARAGGKYSQALRLLENANLKDEAEEKLMKQSALKLYLNLSLCDIKQAKYGRACKYSRKALDIDHRNIKALYRLARALRMLSNYDDAKRQISKARRLDPNNDEVKKELEILDAEMLRTRKSDQDLCRKMLSMNNNIKPTASTQKVKPCSQVVQMVQERLKTFKDEKDMNEMVLPTMLTDEESISVKKVAKEMNLYVYANGNGDIRVTKRPQEEAQR